MYQDASYGANWQPASNTARRIDPYTRPCYALICLFVIGFILIVVVVLSTIPLYLPKTTTISNNNTQVSKVSIRGYYLQMQSPFDGFDPQTILSETNNRQALEAAFTSLIQEDPTMNGSVIEIKPSTAKSNRQRRQKSNLLDIILDLNIIGAKPCSSKSCLVEFRSHAIDLLSMSNTRVPTTRYQLSNSAKIYWICYRLPETIQSDVSFTKVDPKTMSSLLDQLILVDRTQNQPPIGNSTHNLIS